MRQNGVRSNVRFPYGSKGMKKGGRVKVNQGGYIGRYIKGDLGGKKVSNPSYAKYYKGLV